jgi:transcriptional accessory protein Tex/SPT6
MNRFQKLTYKCNIVIDIISTDEDPGLRIESSVAVINLRGVSTNKTIIYVLSPCKLTKNLK